MGAKRLASYTAETFQPSASSSAGYQERLTTRDVLQVAVTVEKSNYASDFRVRANSDSESFRRDSSRRKSFVRLNCPASQSCVSQTIFFSYGNLGAVGLGREKFV